MVLHTETRSSWSVNIVANTGGYKLCGGWSAFVIDNGINKGDICEFKLMSRLEMWVQVTPNPKVASRTSRNGPLSCPPRNAEVKLRTVKPELEHVIQNALKAADASSIGPPSFLTKMQRYNVEYGRILNIPMHFVRENSLSYCTDEKMVLRTETGSSWSVNIVANMGGYKLCGGWSAFVSDNGIKKGDVCEFKLMSRLEMRVEVTPKL
uniref:TF-B3 domain-containing protein n=1 Tax=Kalanchoe fedtschenkoi TaxID=63787 RepID=A0A7N0VEM5_KALFE